MKKIFSIILAVMLIFSCFAVTAFATDMPITTGDIFVDKYAFGYAYFDSQPVISFSEDYKTLYVNDQPFSRADLSKLNSRIDFEVQISKVRNPSLQNSAYVELSDTQLNIIGINICTNEAQNMYGVYLNFDDGMYLEMYFLNDDYREEYTNLLNGKTEGYYIDFGYPAGNTILTTVDKMCGEKATIDANELFYAYEVFDVEAVNKDHSLSMTTGVIYLIDDTYYFYNYMADGIEDSQFMYDDEMLSQMEEITVYKITDEILLAEIELAIDRYYDDDYGILFNSEATEIIAAVFFIIVFAIVPVVVFVVFLIKAIRGKGAYKKIYGVVAILCMLEVVAFTILAVIISPSLSKSNNEEYLGEADDYAIVDMNYNPQEIE